MRLIQFTQITIGAVIFLLSGCGYEVTPSTTSFSGPVVPSTAVTDTFSAIQKNIIQPSCLKCHNGPDSIADLSTYDAVMAYVSPSNPNTSDFYTLIDSGSMPKRAAKLSQEAINSVKSWILKGALNN